MASTLRFFFPISMSITQSINIQTTSINAITPTTGSLSIGDSQTDGVLNVGTGARTATGVINIGTGATRAGIINIGNGGGTGGIAIGSGTSAITTGALTASGQITAQAGIAMSSTAITGASSVTATTFTGSLTGTASNATNIQVSNQSTNGSTFYPIIASTFQSSGLPSADSGFTYIPSSGILTTTAIRASSLDTTSGTITIGNTGNTTTLESGTTNIATAVGSTSAINILNGGGATTGGSVNIANGASQTTTVNLASGTGTGTVTIGNTGNTTNLNSGTINVNGALTMGTGRNITLGTVTNDSTVLNTIVNATTNQTVTLSRVGQTYFLYRSTNTGTIPNTTNTVLHSTTVTNAGIYTINYLTRYSGTTAAIRGQGVQTWIYVSSPATYGGGGFGQVALNLVGYASPYLEMQNVGLAMTGSWTGLVNANATVQTQSYIQYSGTAGGILLGGSSSNYLSITRIA